MPSSKPCGARRAIGVDGEGGIPRGRVTLVEGVDKLFHPHRVVRGQVAISADTCGSRCMRRYRHPGRRWRGDRSVAALRVDAVILELVIDGRGWSIFCGSSAVAVVGAHIAVGDDSAAVCGSCAIGRGRGLGAQAGSDSIEREKQDAKTGFWCSSGNPPFVQDQRTEDSMPGERGLTGDMIKSDKYRV